MVLGFLIQKTDVVAPLARFFLIYLRLYDASLQTSFFQTYSSARHTWLEIFFLQK